MTTFNITIEKMGSETMNILNETIKVLKFNNLKEAKKEISRLVRKEGYKRGYKVYNSELRTELSTNF